MLNSKEKFPQYIYVGEWTSKMVQDDGKTSNHKMLNILRTIYIIYFLSVVKCCILNCSLMIKITVCYPDQMTSYDAKMIKFYVPT